MEVGNSDPGQQLSRPSINHHQMVGQLLGPQTRRLKGGDFPVIQRRAAYTGDSSPRMLSLSDSGIRKDPTTWGAPLDSLSNPPARESFPGRPLHPSVKEAAPVNKQVKLPC